MTDIKKPDKKNSLKVVDIPVYKIKDESVSIFEQIKGKRYMVIVMGDTEENLQTIYFNGDVTMMEVVFHCGLASKVQYDGLLAYQGYEDE